MGSRIVATGRAGPRTAIDNDGLARRMDTSDEWIRSRTGIGRRYALRQGESLAEIAAAASRIAIEQGRIRGGSLVMLNACGGGLAWGATPIRW